MSQLVDFLKKVATEKTDNVQHLYREGTELDKGFVLTEDYLVSIEPFLRKQMEFYSAYPDLFLDQIKHRHSTETSSESVQEQHIIRFSICGQRSGIQIIPDSFARHLTHRHQPFFISFSAGTMFP